MTKISIEQILELDKKRTQSLALRLDPDCRIACLTNVKVDENTVEIKGFKPSKEDMAFLCSTSAAVAHIRELLEVNGRMRGSIQSAIDHIDVSQRDVLFILQQALNQPNKGQ